MKIVVTGAAGFVGSQVLRQLSSAGHEAHAVVRRGYDHARAPSTVRVLELDGDLGDEAARARIAAIGAEACVHCAWVTTPGAYLTSPLNADLQHATVALAEQLASSGCRKLVAVGTCFEYDTGAGTLTEETALTPRHPYSQAKVATYRGLMEIAGQSSMQVAWARLFYLYGPGEAAQRLVPAVTRALLRGEDALCSPGGQLRDFLHVSDVASALCALALGDAGDAVNVCSAEPISVAAIAQRIGAIVGRPERVRLGALPYAADDPMFVVGDNGRLLATGWRPRWTLAEGLADTVAWWRDREATR